MTRHTCFALTVVLLSAGLAEATNHPPGYVLQETVIVPVTGSVVSSVTALAPGARYKIRTSGTFTVGGPGDGQGDAEYANFTSPPASLQDVCGAGTLGEDLGIGVNDTAIDTSKLPHWGAYSSSHEYTVDAPGTGAPIALNYHDCNYTDNSGSLTVEIFRQAGLTVELNQTSFRTGQTMIVTASLSPGYVSGAADAYVVVQLPNGSFLSPQLGTGLVPGIAPLVAGLAWPPSGATPDPLRVELLRYTFTGGEPAGVYTWYSAGTAPGTLNVVGPLAAQPFTFVP